MSALVPEGEAFRMAMQLPRAKEWNAIMMESDSQILLKEIYSQSEETKSDNIVADMKALQGQIYLCSCI